MINNLAHTKSKILVVTIGLIAQFFAWLGYAEDETLFERQHGYSTYSFNSASFSTNLPSPYSLVEYYRNFENLAALTTDIIDDTASFFDVDNAYQRSFFLLNKLILSDNIFSPNDYILTTGIETVHEYAHRTRGATHRGTEIGFNNDYTPYGDNPYSFSTGLFLKGNETGSAIWDNGRQTTHFTNSRLTIDESLITTGAAGINQQANLAKDHARRASLRNAIDVSQWWGYFYNATAYFSYDNELLPYIFGSKSNYNPSNPDPFTRYDGDREQMILSWRLLGYNYNDDQLAREQLLAYFASGTTWAYIAGMYGYIVDNEREHALYRFLGLRAPDFYTYYNINGPSLRVATDYKWSDNLYIIGEYEFIYDNGNNGSRPVPYDSDQELTFGVAYAWDEYDVTSTATISVNPSSLSNMNMHGEVTYYPIDLLGVGLHANHYNYDTLSGFRDIPYAKNKKSHQEILAVLSLSF